MYMYIGYHVIQAKNKLENMCARVFVTACEDFNFSSMNSNLGNLPLCHVILNGW